MIPLNQSEINVYKNAFAQFQNKLSDTCALITWDDMPKLLRELGKAHSETDAKTLFNELEIAGDGSGWILDLTTFMVMMMHSGHKKPSLKRASLQWKYLMKNGSLISTETIPEDATVLTKHIEDAIAKHTGNSGSESQQSKQESLSMESQRERREKQQAGLNNKQQQQNTSEIASTDTNNSSHNNSNNSQKSNSSKSQHSTKENNPNNANSNEIGDNEENLPVDTALIANIIEDEARYKYKCFERSEARCLRYPNYQIEYGIEFPGKKTVQDLAKAALSHAQNEAVSDESDKSKSNHEGGKVGFVEQNGTNINNNSSNTNPPKPSLFGCFSCTSKQTNTIQT